MNKSLLVIPLILVGMLMAAPIQANNESIYTYSKSPTKLVTTPANTTETLTRGYKNNTTYQPDRYPIVMDTGTKEFAGEYPIHVFMRWNRSWRFNCTISKRCDPTIRVLYSDENGTTMYYNYTFTNTSTVTIKNISNTVLYYEEGWGYYTTVEVVLYASEVLTVNYTVAQLGNYKLKFTQNINRTREYELKYINGTVDAVLMNYSVLNPPNVSLSVKGESYTLKNWAEIFDLNYTEAFTIDLSIVSNSMNFTLIWDVNMTAVHLYHFPTLKIYTNLQANMTENQTLELNISVGDGSFPIAGLNVNVKMNNDTIKSISRGQIYQYNLTVNPNTNGTLTWGVTTDDMRGNTTKIKKSVTVKIQSISPSPDTTNPILTILSPDNGTMTNTTTTVKWEGEDNHAIDHYDVHIDDGAWHTTTNTSYTVTADGEHIVSIKAVDSNGNTATKHVTFTIDTTNPTLSILSQNVNTTTVTVEWEGGDNMGIDHYEVRLDNGTWIRTNKSRHQFQVSQGNHTVTVKAVDNAGNIVTKEIQFTVSTQQEPNDNGGRTLMIAGGIAIGMCTMAILLLKFKGKRLPFNLRGRKNET